MNSFMLDSGRVSQEVTYEHVEIVNYPHDLLCFGWDRPQQHQKSEPKVPGSVRKTLLESRCCASLIHASNLWDGWHLSAPTRPDATSSFPMGTAPVPSEAQSGSAYTTLDSAATLLQVSSQSATLAGRLRLQTRSLPRRWRFKSMVGDMVVD